MAEDIMIINPEQKNIREIFQNTFIQIPRFQRPYSWDNEEISDFMDDLSNSEAGKYFLGSMVFFKKNPNSEESSVVDGQQRLTTITILLSVLRNSFQEIGDKNIANGIHQLIQRKNIDDEDEFIIFSETSRPYFQDRIQTFAKPELELEPGPEEKALQAAHDYFTSEIQKIKKEKKNIEDYRSVIMTLRDKILALKFISIELGNEDDAYIVFETLNTRGKNLEQSDLIKNLITRYMPKGVKKFDLVSVKWSAILNNIHGSNVEIKTDEFLLHQWLSDQGYIAGKNLFRSVKGTITKARAKQYLEKIEEESKYYRTILEPNYWPWKKEEQKIRKSLEAFQIFRIKQSTPFVLAILSEYNHGNISKKQAERALLGIENFHFIFTAVTSQRSSGGISQMYSSAARELRDGVNKDEKATALKKLKEKLVEKVPEYEEFLFGFMDVQFSKSYTRQKALVRYALRKFAEEIHKNPFDDDSYSIEHIGSQSSKEFSEESKFGFGNLIYVPTRLNNEELGDKKFDDKKDILKENNIPMDEWVENAVEWNDVEIELRVEGLAELAYSKIWSV